MAKEEKKRDAKKIIKWISWKEAEGDKKLQEAKELVPYWFILVDYFKDNDYIIYGSTHQSDDFRGVPVFDDNCYLAVSMRTWGNIMASCVNEREHTNKYDYLDFYMPYPGCRPEKWN